MMKREINMREGARDKRIQIHLIPFIFKVISYENVIKITLSKVFFYVLILAHVAREKG